MIYLIGSLRNPQIPTIAEQLRSAGHDVFDDWYAAGPNADDCWRDYEKARGHTLPEALQGHAAQNVFNFDRRHLERADAVVLAMPAGKSAFLELGWSLGRGKKGFILLDADPERYDVMFQFATGVYDNLEDLIDELNAPAEVLPEIGYQIERILPLPVKHSPSCISADCSGDCWGDRRSWTLTNRSNYEPPTDQLSQVPHQTDGLHPSHPRLGISCGCAVCIRSRGDSGGGRTLGWTEQEILKILDKK